jgi:hypothetical protein
MLNRSDPAAVETNVHQDTAERVRRDDDSTAPARRHRVQRPYLPTLVIAALAAWLSWRGWLALGDTGLGRSVNVGRFELAGPVVLCFVVLVTVIERLWPAERRPLLARGHVLDVGYLLFYATLVVPLIVLLGAGFAGLLARALAST